MSMTPNILFHNRYRLIELKGRGSFGEVWFARDEELGLEVALKVYIALDDRGVAEFKSEYKTTFGLNHPNLLHANHFNLCEQRPYLVMPYCPSSATNYIGNIDEPTLWRFIRDVASGLEYLHDMEIVHQDIKPDNILVDTEGNFLITDFGISKKMRSTLRRNSLRQMEEQLAGGSVAYMGPEMFSKQPESVKATDIWALGATLFELCEGELPFFGQGGGMQLNGAAIPVLHGDYSDDLKRVVQMCLSKETWDRPLASQLCEYAQAKLDGQLTQEHIKFISDRKEDDDNSFNKIGTVNENNTKKRKRKSMVGAASAIIVIVIIAVILMAVFKSPKESPEQIIARENIEVYEQKVKACQANIDAGAYEEGKYVKLLSARKELEEIKNLEEIGKYFYPDTYNQYELMNSQLDSKSRNVGLRYASHAQGFIELDPEMAMQEYSIAKQLYPDYTSPEYESFMKNQISITKKKDPLEKYEERYPIE